MQQQIYSVKIIRNLLIDTAFAWRIWNSYFVPYFYFCVYVHDLNEN